MGLVVFLIISSLIVSLFFVSVKINFIYNDELAIYLKILFIKIRLYPIVEKKIKLSKYSLKNMKKRQAKRRKAAIKNEKKPTDKMSGTRKTSAQKSAEKKSFKDTAEMVRFIVHLIRISFNKFFRYLSADIKQLHIKVASEDAAKTAVLYGGASQAAAYLIHFLSENFQLHFKGKNCVGVYADFVGSSFDAVLDISLKIRIWQIVSILFTAMIKFIKNIISRQEGRT